MNKYTRYRSIYSCDYPPEWDIEEPICDECGGVLEVDIDEDDFGVTTITYCEVCDE